MTNDDFKKILDKGLEPIREDLSGIKETLAGHTKTLEDHTRRLEALAGDVESLHLDVKGIKEKESLFHSRNKREIDEIKTHLNLPLMPDVPAV